MISKKIGFILIASMLTIGCSSTTEKSKKEAKVNENKSKTAEKKNGKFGTEKNSDFRSANWGITVQDVTKIEIDKDVFDIPDLNGLGFYEEILGINALVMYQFEDNKLVKGSYNASGKDITEEKYMKIKETLTKKYGEFKIIDDIHSSEKIMIAKTAKTVVRYFTDFEYSDMKLEYFDINYYNKQNNASTTSSSIEESSDKLF